MIWERAVAVVAGALAAAFLFLVVPSAVYDLLTYQRAKSWPSVWGNIDRYMKVSEPRVIRLVQGPRYLLVDYRYSIGSTIQKGQATLPIDSGISSGARVEVKVKPNAPGESYLVMTLADYRLAAILKLLGGLVLGALLLWAAKHVWHFGTRGPWHMHANSSSSGRVAGGAGRRRST